MARIVSLLPPPPSPPLFPYTTLFRSPYHCRRGEEAGQRDLAWIALLAEGRGVRLLAERGAGGREQAGEEADRKSTRLNSSHSSTSYAVFCLKKKNKTRW